MEASYLDERVCRDGDFVLLLRHSSLQVSDLLIQQFPLLSVFIVFIVIALILVVVVFILVILPFTSFFIIAQCEIKFRGEFFVNITLRFGFFSVALFSVFIRRVESCSCIACL